MIEIRPEVKHGIVARNPHSLFRYHGWPTVTKDEHGVLYATASGMRIQHVDPAGKNCMYISYNDGESWSPPIVVNDSYLDDRDTGICYVGNGRMLITWFSQRDDENYARFETYDWLRDPEKKLILGMGQVQGILEDEKRVEGHYVKISEDYGVTWTENIRVPVCAPHGPNVMRDGSLMYLSIIPDGENKRSIGAYRSIDMGRTWKLRGVVPHPEELVPEMLCEPHITEMPDGRLLGAIRVHCRPVEPSFTVYTTVSEDKGRTWSTPECIGVNGSPPHLLVHSSGAVICSYACRDDEGKSERACVSYDCGRTWSEDYVLNDNVPYSDLGYPATVELSDGSLLTVYYQCWPGDDFCSILYTKWKLTGHEE